MTIDRYSRQIILPEIGRDGQTKISNAKILIIGLGGLGSPASLYLAAAGVGTLGIMDEDDITTSNLQRQILYHEEHAGKSKVIIAKNELLKLNSEVHIETHHSNLNEENALEIISKYDLVIDGTDQFSAKFLINDAACLMNKPVVHGAIQGFEGEAAIFLPKSGPCYRCYRNKSPESNPISCNFSGILGPIAGFIGSFQATLALQWIISGGDQNHSLYPVPGYLHQFAFDGAFHSQSYRIKIHPECRNCGLNPQQSLITEENSCEEVSIISLESTADQINKGSNILLVDVRDEEEWKMAHHPLAIHWPLHRIRAGDLPESTERYDQIVFYCKSGLRSKEAAALFIRAGIRNVLSATPFRHPSNILSSKSGIDV